MKKISITILFILLICTTVRTIYSYTIVNIPYIFGTRTYVGNSKYDFPICIVNFLKIKNIKKDIIHCLKNKTNLSNMDNIFSFFGTIDEPFDFDIISVATSKEGISTNKNVDSFLLQQQENPEKKCVVIMDKKTKQILRFGF